MAKGRGTRYDAAMKILPRILVTGAGGYIGRHVVQALAGRAEVIPAIVDGARADLLDPAQRRKLIEQARAQILIHLAWVTDHGAFWTAPENTAWQDASVDLFQQFYDADGQRILATGSCAEYDWTTGAQLYAEDAPLAPHTLYGQTKVATAAALAACAAAHDKSWAWGRIFFSFGVGEPAKRLIPLMFNAVRTGQSLGIGPGNAVRDFWPVDVLGAAIAATALTNVTGPVNLGGAGVSFVQLAAMIEKIAGTQGLIIPDSRPLGPGEPMDLVPDTTKLRAEVGFDAQPDLTQALAAYYDAG